MNTASHLYWKNRFSRESYHCNLTMTLIGGWADICAYYRSQTGNAWSYQPCLGWVNQGPADEFIQRVKDGKIRGELL